MNGKNYVVSHNIVIAGNINCSNVGYNNNNNGVQENDYGEKNFQEFSSILLESLHSIDEIKICGSSSVHLSSSYMYPMVNMIIQGNGKIFLSPISSIYKTITIKIQGNGSVSSTTSKNIITEILTVKIQGNGNVRKIHSTRKVSTLVQGNGNIQITADINANVSQKTLGLGNISIKRI
jgi:hypothetical protein